ncbi:hypothetical protein BDN71DRAFT_1433247 [Pleurotus eryngii]|uniref:Endonuclease/exonuclease/phosphatase domain-containing protein n=1 Tax=Pleurotus eryngii TaxID=5323 RepID=A0A9P6DDS6_PLEER|nr:hypothetical protein BDN71DRAFT_1433247 [Pleurotus eryngii]
MSETQLQTLEMMRKANPEVGQRFFIEKENPETWGQAEEGSIQLAEGWRTEGTGGFGRRIASKVGTERWDMTGILTVPRRGKDWMKLTQTTLGVAFRLTEPANTNDEARLEIFQINLNKSQTAQDELINSLHRNNIILVQELWVNAWGFARVTQQYHVIYLFGLEEKCWWIRIINIYNNCKHDCSLKAIDNFLTEERQTQNEMAHDQMIWAGDFNQHHPMWDEERNHHLFMPRNMEASDWLIDLADRFRMVMKLEKGVPTLCTLNTNNYTWVDNVWCSEAIQVVSDLAYELV